MKKLFSSVLVLAMVLSMFTFTVQAGTNGKYSVSYEAINVASGDVNNLAEGDTFFAVVKLTGAEGLFSGQVDLKWDSSVVKAIKANGTDDASTFANAVDSNTRLHMAAKSYSDDEGMDVAAFEQNGSDYSAGSISYIFSAAMIDGGFKDYLLSGDQVIFKLRLKVVKEGNANITYTNARVCEVMTDGADRATTVDIPALTIGSSTPVTPPPAGDDTTEQKAKATATYMTGMTGIRFNVSNGDKTVGYAVPFSTGTQLEAASKVSIGLTVTGIPSGESVTITAENYYGSQFKVALK